MVKTTKKELKILLKELEDFKQKEIEMKEKVQKFFNNVSNEEEKYIKENDRGFYHKLNSYYGEMTMHRLIKAAKSLQEFFEKYCKT